MNICGKGVVIMKFSEYFGLETNKQQDFEFVNIRVDIDNRLFIDPTRLQGLDTQWARNYEAKIQDFFFTIFELYIEGNRSVARNLFTSSGESNEIYIGYSKGFPSGNGNSPDSLQLMFDFVHRHGLLSEIIVGRIEDFPVFVPKFGPDLLSDLIASILKQELINFTIEQCELWNIKRDYKLTRDYWNSKNKKWEKDTGDLPHYKSKDGRLFPIVLLPKRIVVVNDIYNAKGYWSQVAGEWRQRYHAENNTNLHKSKSERYPYVSKEDIRKEEQREDEDFKEYLTRLTRENPIMIEDYRKNIENIQRGTHSNQMTDEDFDNFMKESYEDSLSRQ